MRGDSHFFFRFTLGVRLSRVEHVDAVLERGFNDFLQNQKRQFTL